MYCANYQPGIPYRLCTVAPVNRMTMATEADELGIQLFKASSLRPKARGLSAPADSVESVAVQSRTSFDVVTVADVQSNKVDNFARLGMHQWQIDTLAGLAIQQPTTIQQACIPAILAGRAVLGAAKTGSGKTAAFALPILRALSEDIYGPFALVLTPTRELALQIAEQFQVLGSGIRVQVAVVVGGVDIVKQATEVSRRPHIIVATPGRLMDLVTGGSLDTEQIFRQLRFCVLDEADRLLDPASTFQTLGEVPAILRALPVATTTQLLLFSATVSARVESYFAGHCSKLSERGLLFRGNAEYGTVARTSQTCLLVPSQARDCYLYHLLRTDFANSTVIVFVGKCKTCELMRLWLKELGMDVATLHSQMKQADRLDSLARFKGGQLKVLVCTDVASRGLDIPAVEAVINYDVPLDARDYVHRIGRTGRAGRSGLALTIATELDLELIEAIESRIAQPLSEHPEPPESDALALLGKVTTAKRTASASLLDRSFGQRRDVNRKKWAAASRVPRGSP